MWRDRGSATYGGRPGVRPGVWSQASEQLGLPVWTSRRSTAGGCRIPGDGGRWRRSAVPWGVCRSTPPPYSPSERYSPPTTSKHGEYLPGIAAGRTTATVAAAETGTSSASEVRTSAERDGSGFVLTGSKCFVVDGCTADLLVVVAQSPAGLSLFAVPGVAPGLTRTAMQTLDPTRKVARLTLDRAPGRLIGPEGSAPTVLDQLRDRASSHSRVNSSEWPRAPCPWRWPTPRRGCSSAGPSAPSRRSAPLRGHGSAHRSGAIGNPVGSRGARRERRERRERGELGERRHRHRPGQRLQYDAAVFATAENVQVHGGIGSQRLYFGEHARALPSRRRRRRYAPTETGGLR